MKRAFDILLSGFGLLLLAPLFAIIALAVLAGLGSPIFFRQTRPGLKGAPFEMIKFRTMLSFDEADHRRSDADRLTPFGSFLRSSSLDELPELWNVLKGDMSIVGPRPLLMEYLPLYTAEQLRRHEMRPGITGWAQVNGRNAISWEAKFEHDLWYIDNNNFRLDLRILWLTFKKVVVRDGINAAGSATMPEFRGTDVDVSGD